ncbi:MAG: transcriptional repressor, partial [Propionibacteriaceae bacterium]|nr:transcriptional repressor [Propionibacteriaceae bacterium]
KGPGARQTRQRAAIERHLADRLDFETAQQIHDCLRRQGEAISLATVYRTLQQLADAGLIDILHPDDSQGQASYRRCSPAHHHHLVCRRCGTAAEVEGEAVERWVAEVAALHGFTDTDHAVEVYGLCGPCAKAKA